MGGAPATPTVTAHRQVRRAPVGNTSSPHGPCWGSRGHSPPPVSAEGARSVAPLSTLAERRNGRQTSPWAPPSGTRRRSPPMRWRSTPATPFNEPREAWSAVGRRRPTPNRMRTVDGQGHRSGRGGVHQPGLLATPPGCLASVLVLAFTGREHSPASSQMFDRILPAEARETAGWRIENGQHLSVDLPPVTV